MFVLRQLATRPTKHQGVNQEASSVSMATRAATEWRLGPSCPTAPWLTLSSLFTVTEMLWSSSQLLQVNGPDYSILPLMSEKPFILHCFSRSANSAPGMFLREIMCNVTVFNFKNCEPIRHWRQHQRQRNERLFPHTTHLEDSSTSKTINSLTGVAGFTSQCK